MVVTFISNYINHHQIPFSNACHELLGDNYHFVQTQPMEQERLAMGWNAGGEKLSYVHCLYEEEEFCRKLIMDSDVLLAGWTGREELIIERLQAGKLTVRISERLYREGQWKAISPRGLLHKYLEHTRYRRSPAYLLCTGAYVASDFHIVRAYPHKMFKWGYFPETRNYTQQQMEEMKYADGKVHIVWAGRFIPLKHPEYMLRLAASLKEERKNNPLSYPEFHIHMIGSGELWDQIQQQAKQLQVEEDMTFYGFQSPEEVRSIMEKCHMHVFTSNYLEGWGAVVNESMNSGCTVVANVQVGAVPYLIQHKGNGMVYPDDSYEGMKAAVQFLLTHPNECRQMGFSAYQTIQSQWNAKEAATRLLSFLKQLKAGEDFAPYEEGPLSVAPVISPKKMYGIMIKESERRKQ